MLLEGCPKVDQKLSKSCTKVAQMLPRDIKTEMFTKIVPVRAVNMPIGAFCTEFRRESFYVNDVFGRQTIGVGKLSIGVGKWAIGVWKSTFPCVFYYYYFRLRLLFLLFPSSSSSFF